MSTDVLRKRLPAGDYRLRLRVPEVIETAVKEGFAVTIKDGKAYAVSQDATIGIVAPVEVEAVGADYKPSIPLNILPGAEELPTKRMEVVDPDYDARFTLEGPDYSILENVARKIDSLPHVRAELKRQELMELLSFNTLYLTGEGVAHGVVSMRPEVYDDLYAFPIEIKVEGPRHLHGVYSGLDRVRGLVRRVEGKKASIRFAHETPLEITIGDTRIYVAPHVGAKIAAYKYQRVNVPHADAIVYTMDLTRSAIVDGLFVSGEIDVLIVPVPALKAFDGYALYGSVMTAEERRKAISYARKRGLLLKYIEGHPYLFSYRLERDDVEAKRLGRIAKSILAGETKAKVKVHGTPESISIHGKEFIVRAGQYRVSVELDKDYGEWMVMVASKQLARMIGGGEPEVELIRTQDGEFFAVVRSPAGAVYAMRLFPHTT